MWRLYGSSFPFLVYFLTYESYDLTPISFVYLSFFLQIYEMRKKYGRMFILVFFFVTNKTESGSGDSLIDVFQYFFVHMLQFIKIKGIINQHLRKLYLIHSRLFSFDFFDTFCHLQDLTYRSDK